MTFKMCSRISRRCPCLIVHDFHRTVLNNVNSGCFHTFILDHFCTSIWRPWESTFIAWEPLFAWHGRSASMCSLLRSQFFYLCLCLLASVAICAAARTFLSKDSYIVTLARLDIVDVEKILSWHHLWSWSMTCEVTHTSRHIPCGVRIFLALALIIYC